MNDQSFPAYLIRLLTTGKKMSMAFIAYGGDKITNDKETPEERRERLRQEELKNPSSSIHGSGLSDLVGSLGWKGTGILILALIIGFIIYGIFLR